MFESSSSIYRYLTFLCFQYWIRLRLAFLVICFPCCVFDLFHVFVVFCVHDITLLILTNHTSPTSSPY
jgi:hypothetical protein